MRLRTLWSARESTGSTPRLPLLPAPGVFTADRRLIGISAVAPVAGAVARAVFSGARLLLLQRPRRRLDIARLDPENEAETAALDGSGSPVHVDARVSEVAQHPGGPSDSVVAGNHESGRRRKGAQSTRRGHSREHGRILRDQVELRLSIPDRIGGEVHELHPALLEPAQDAIGLPGLVGYFERVRFHLPDGGVRHAPSLGRIASL